MCILTTSFHSFNVKNNNNLSLNYTTTVEAKSDPFSKHHENGEKLKGKELYKAYAKQKCDDNGWNDAEYKSLIKLWNNESGWRVAAANPTRTARGIPQALAMHQKWSEKYLTDYKVQINWGIKYISRRYGTPTKALSFWNSQSPHWY